MYKLHTYVQYRVVTPASRRRHAAVNHVLPCIIQRAPSSERPVQPRPDQSHIHNWSCDSDAASAHTQTFVTSNRYTWQTAMRWHGSVQRQTRTFPTHLGSTRKPDCRCTIHSGDLTRDTVRQSPLSDGHVYSAYSRQECRQVEAQQREEEEESAHRSRI